MEVSISHDLQTEDNLQDPIHRVDIQGSLTKGRSPEQRAMRGRLNSLS